MGPFQFYQLLHSLHDIKEALRPSIWEVFSSVATCLAAWFAYSSTVQSNKTVIEARNSQIMPMVIPDNEASISLDQNFMLNVRNVGKGAAVSVKASLNQVTINDSRLVVVPEFSSSFNLQKHGDKSQLETILKNVEGDIELVLDYLDVYGNKFKTIAVFKINPTDYTTYSIDNQSLKFLPYV